VLIGPEGANPEICQKLCKENPTFCVFYAWEKLEKHCLHRRSAIVTCSQVIGQSKFALEKNNCKIGKNFVTELCHDTKGNNIQHDCNLHAGTWKNGIQLCNIWHN